MARAAVSGGLKVRRAWRAARLIERRIETASASTLVLEVPGWPGHLAGQHAGIRLTAPDGYQAARSYSLPHCEWGANRDHRATGARR